MNLALRRLSCLCLTVLAIWMTGCEKDGEPFPPNHLPTDSVPPRGPFDHPKPPITDPVVTPSSFHTGDTGSGIVLTDYGSAGVFVSVSQYSTQEYFHQPVANLNATMLTKGYYWYSSSGTSAAMEKGLYIQLQDIQVTGTWAQDSIFRCQYWASDSSSTSISVRNKGAGSICSDAQFLRMDSKQKPFLYPVGQLIDSTLPWITLDKAYLLYHKGTQYSGTLIDGTPYDYIETTSYDFTSSGATLYLPFRFMWQGSYHYGYVKLASSTIGAMVYATAYMP